MAYTAGNPVYLAQIGMVEIAATLSRRVGTHELRREDDEAALGVAETEDVYSDFAHPHFASMGPQLWEPRKQAINGVDGTLYYKLQWGRSSGSRGNALLQGCHLVHTWASMGPQLWEPRKPAGSTACGSAMGCFNGAAALGAAETPCRWL